ncbi:MAG: CPBP family intramembrane metalloprotease [Bacillota bacterium]|nr:CPBP family intramembrane metalloprotease [Bacillota bacterium]
MKDLVAGPMVVLQCAIGAVAAVLYFPLSVMIVSLSPVRVSAVFWTSAKLPRWQRLVSVAMSCLIEELAWRVTVLGLSGAWWWVVLTSVAFTLLHFVHNAVLVVMEVAEFLVFSMVLAVLARTTGTPWVGLGFHAGRNLMLAIVKVGYAKQAATDRSV